MSGRRECTEEEKRILMQHLSECVAGCFLFPHERERRIASVFLQLALWIVSGVGGIVLLANVTRSRLLGILVLLVSLILAGAMSGLVMSRYQNWRMRRFFQRKRMFLSKATVLGIREELWLCLMEDRDEALSEEAVILDYPLADPEGEKGKEKAGDRVLLLFFEKEGRQCLYRVFRLEHPDLKALDDAGEKAGALAVKEAFADLSSGRHEFFPGLNHFEKEKRIPKWQEAGQMDASGKKWIGRILFAEWIVLSALISGLVCMADRDVRWKMLVCMAVFCGMGLLCVLVWKWLERMMKKRAKKLVAVEVQDVICCACRDLTNYGASRPQPKILLLVMEWDEAAGVMERKVYENPVGDVGDPGEILCKYRTQDGKVFFRKKSDKELQKSL